jgi:hypothetical protein
MQPNFLRQFHDLAEGYRHKEVPEDALRELVWETFKAYANSLPTLASELATLLPQEQMDRIVAIMRERGVTFDQELVAKLRAEPGLNHG